MKGQAKPNEDASKSMASMIGIFRAELLGRKPASVAAGGSSQEAPAALAGAPPAQSQAEAQSKRHCSEAPGPSSNDVLSASRAGEEGAENAMGEDGSEGASSLSTLALLSILK